MSSRNEPPRIIDSVMVARVLTSLCITLAACSGGTGPATDVRTVLFTNALGSDYFAVAVDNAIPPRLDTALLVPNGAQVCLRLSHSTLTLDELVELLSADEFGNVIADVYIRPPLGSWTWNGAAPNATAAPPCQ